MGGRAVAYRRLALRLMLVSPEEVVLPVGHIDTHSIRWSLDVHFIDTLPVFVTSRHSREACPVLDTGAGIQGGQEPWGLDACFRRHDVLLASDLRNRHLMWSQTPLLALVSCPLSRWEREPEASPAMPKEVT